VDCESAHGRLEASSQANASLRFFVCVKLTKFYFFIKMAVDYKTYYIYLHRRNDTGEVFYVGKGTNTPRGKYQRAFHKRKRSRVWNAIVSKSGYSIEILVDYFVEEDAFIMERQQIAFYGRYCDGGRLCNLTMGGEGSSGFVPTKKTREKLRQANSGELHANWGKKLSLQTCRKKSESMRISPLNLSGKKLPDWWKQRIAVTKVGPLNPMYGRTGAAHPNSIKVLDNSNGHIFPSVTAAAKFINIKTGTLYSMLFGLNPNKTQMELAWPIPKPRNRAR
jgi:hypothetical protein